MNTIHLQAVDRRGKGTMADIPRMRWVQGTRTCRGDYSTDADLEHGTHCDDFYRPSLALPALPVPDLRSTLSLYLASVEALAGPEELARTAQCAGDFQRPGGLGEALQGRLEARAAQCVGSSWLQEWWNVGAYLAPRDSLVINSNYFFHFVDEAHRVPAPPAPGPGAQAHSAARLLTGLLHFRDGLVAGTAPVDAVRDSPNCCAGYKYVFNACRVPKPNADEIRLYDPTQYNAVCVLRHNHFYLLPVYPPDGERLSTLELAMGLQKVVDMAGDTAGPAVGVLTADPREKWAEVRARLIAEGNSAALEQIESAILVVCLDDHVPGDGTAVGRLLLHGALSGANNRFFDKTFELVVFADGQAGLNAEHSMFDGGVTLAVVTYVLQGLCDGTVDHGPATARGVLPEPHPIVFKLGESVLQSIAAASRALEDRAGTNDLAVLQFRAFGREDIKRLKCSPDAFTQMALQLAYRRAFGRSAATYESTSTRHFRHGRTETTRSLSSAARDFVTAMTAGAPPETQHKALRAAMEQHVRYFRAASQGRGADRHLLGLQRLLRPGERADLFDDPMFEESRTWRLSTSNVSSPWIQAVGFGEVVPDGVGVCYGLRDDGIYFTIASRRAADGWVAAMCRELEVALVQMRALCVEFGGAAGSPLSPGSPLP